MKFKIGDEVCVSCNFERYKQACLKGKHGYVVKIDEYWGWDCPITVKFEEIYNHNSKHGYFYFKEDELRLIHKTDNFGIIDFNKRLKEITDKHGLISSFHWSDEFHGYLYDFYRDAYYFCTDENRVTRVLVKPKQFDKIDKALSNIDEHLAEMLNPMSYQIKRLGHLHLDQFETLVKKEKESNMLKGKIKKVIFNDPATIVFWKDGTKTVVKANNEEFDPEKGLSMAIAKKAFGNEGNYFNEIKKWLPHEKLGLVGLAMKYENAKHSNDLDCQSTLEDKYYRDCFTLIGANKLLREQMADADSMIEEILCSLSHGPDNELIRQAIDIYNQKWKENDI